MFVLHELLRPNQVEARRYQLQLAEAAARDPILLVLPTGLGKTAAALLTILRVLEKGPSRRVLVLAPTKPLVEQHVRFFRKSFVPDVEVHAVTGEDAPDRRTDAWRRGRIVCATPQVVRNDVVRGTLDLASFHFLILDEAHRGVGNYPYVFIAQRFEGHRMGLSASPGTDLPTIRRVLENLRLARTEVRTERDADVRAYVHQVETDWVRVAPNADLVHTARLLQRSLNETLLALRRTGVLDGVPGQPSRKQLVDLGMRLRAEAARSNARPGVYQALSFQARALKIEHALELCETQGPGPLARFLERTLRESQRAGGSKAARDWAASDEFVRALDLARTSKEPHPKLSKLLAIVREQLEGPSRRVLVFAHYRETAEDLVAHLSSLPGVKADRFVGHAKASDAKGLTKREQQRVVDAFRHGDVNVLVATSVGEEGLDLPDCDAVVLYEPVASGIRMIQRRGRTGRRRDGRFFVLMTEGTRDSAYYWSAMRREKRMNQELRVLRSAPSVPVEPAMPSPTSAERPNAPEVTVDTREFQSPLVRRLIDDGLRVKAERLEVGDYRVGDGFLIERKSSTDFVASIVDGRFFEQVPKLGSTGQGILLVEGGLDGGALSRNAVAGAAAAAWVEHGVGLVVVPDANAASDFVAAVARRALRATAPARPRPRVDKAPVDQRGLVRHLLEGIPGVGPALADRLAGRFGSMAGLCRASLAELGSVEGVGPKRALEIHSALRLEADSGTHLGATEDLALKAGDGAAG